MNGYLLNLTTDGTCTGTTDQECAVFSSNQTGNYSVLPPIRSARLTTRLSHSIRYGKIEVKARMPTGDWIWPASKSEPLRICLPRVTAYLLLPRSLDAADEQRLRAVASVRRE